MAIEVQEQADPDYCRDVRTAIVNAELRKIARASGLTWRQPSADR